MEGGGGPLRAGLEPDEDVFDVVIVGAGPSAAGLLRGLLLRPLPADASRAPRIAIVERGLDGGTATWDDYDDYDDDPEEECTTDDRARWGGGRGYVRPSPPVDAATVDVVRGVALAFTSTPRVVCKPARAG